MQIFDYPYFDFIVRINRTNITNSTSFGILQVLDKDLNLKFECKTLELMPNFNKINKSSIPTGLYMLLKEHHKTKGNVLRIPDVLGRSGILIHAGNTARDTKGCILVGEAIIQPHSVNIFKIKNSRKTLDKLYGLLSGEYILQIMDGSL